MAKKNSSGYLYVLSNPCFTYLKIGHTKNAPQQRCAQLSRSTAIPKPFKLEIEVRVANCPECERQLHNILVEYNVGKEFYNISVQKVRKIIDKSFEYVDRIDYLRKLMKRY